MKRIDVYYEGWGERWKLGTLAHHARIMMFEYSSEALTQKLELSPLVLPLRAEAFSDFPRTQHQLPGLIADSLPDGWGMLLMDRYFKTLGLNSPTISPLDRLSFLGDRTMGALTFSPADSVAEPSDVDVGLLDLAKQAQQVMKGKDSELLKKLVLMGGSPHGARPKVLVDYCQASGDMSTKPAGAVNGKPWLIKFQAQDEHKEVCIIEHCYAGLARQCELDMPQTEYFDISPKLGGFGIERFDVEASMRVPTLTLAGSLDADFRQPELDYASFLRATLQLTADIREVEKAFARMVFNVVFNNRDDHPKNFSFRLDQSRQWKLAPCYDLTYSKGPSGYHQMDAMGEALHIARKHLLGLASSVGLAVPKAKNIIEQHLSIATQLPKVLTQANVRKQTIREITTQVNENIQRLK